MRYIVNSNNYVVAISFGTDMIYNDCVCTEYTGRVPSGWNSLEEWHEDEGEKLWRWKIVGGNLTLDPAATAPKEGRWGKSLFNDYMEGDLEEVESDFVGEVRANSFEEYNTLKSVNFTDATSVGEYAFYKSINLEHVSIPKAISVGQYAFWQCTALNSVDLSGAENIEYRSFGYTNFNTLEFPSATEVSYAAFDNATINKLKLPAMKAGFSLQNAGSVNELYLPEIEYDLRVFADANTQIVYAPKLITGDEYIGAASGSGTFSGCSNLTDVYLESLQEADFEMFKNCTSLKRVDFPSTLVSFQNSVFSGCTALETVIFRSAAVPEFHSSNPFVGSPVETGTAYIYVPKALLEAYKTDSFLDDYAAQFRAIEDYPEITAKQVYPG